MEGYLKMIDYKPWFQNVSSLLMAEELNPEEEETDYKSEYERILKENKILRSIIENVSSDKCKLSTEINKLYIEVNELSIEVNELKSCLVENIDMGEEDESVFSNDCSTAIKELLEIIKNNKHFKYTCHRKKEIENAYYSIINNIGITIFYLEDHSKNNWHGLGGLALITTPRPGGIVEGYKHKYASVTDGWDKRTTSRSSRKKYDIRGKKVMDVMNIFNKFR